jgi:uncharacterized MAPEG superfamily protein
MSPIQALLGFGAWTLFLLMLSLSWRVPKILLGTPADSWTRGTDAIKTPPVFKRANDAHLNCLENLPIFTVLVLSASAMGKLDIIAPYAAYVFYLRLAQSTVHLVGVNHWLVWVRSTLWFPQVGLFAFMFWQLLR